MSEPRRRGRPPVPADDKAVRELRLKVSDDLYAQICAISLKTGRPLWVIARMMLERDAKRMVHP